MFWNVTYHASCKSARENVGQHRWATERSNMYTYTCYWTNFVELLFPNGAIYKHVTHVYSSQ